MLDLAVSTLRVASVPASHVYIRHLADPDGSDGVVRLRDVPPADGRKVPGGWWPPVMLDSGWVDANHGSFDVFHVHFGFDAKTPDELDGVGRSLAAHGKPLVLTVHDLRNPHHADPQVHDGQLGALLAHADRVITLTPGAAAALAERWDVEAQVLPHPHVVEPSLIAAERPARDGFVVGLHAKSVRANMDVVPVARAAAEAVAALPGARLRIDLHPEVFEPGYYHAPEVGNALRELAASSDVVELCEHDYFSDDELWDYLRAIDVSVLPYRFGTHSGWLEACFDLGTAVVAPTCGFYAEQRPVHAYVHDEDRFDAASLRGAIRDAYEVRPAPRADVEERLAERRMLAAAHRELYGELTR
jgi:glycosyltransferase involved in cell wall biosynthesis